MKSLQFIFNVVYLFFISPFILCFFIDENNYITIKVNITIVFLFYGSKGQNTA